MSIPDFQTVMLPLLEFARDGREHTLVDSIANLATHFNLTDAERKELLPLGKQSRFNNRVGGLVVYSFQESWIICLPLTREISDYAAWFRSPQDTARAHQSLLLKQFPEYLEFIGATAKSPDLADCPLNQPPSVEQTPDEVMDSAYQELRLNLAQELLERIKSCSPAFFDRLVIELLVKMGYGGSLADAGKAIGRTGDEGIDGIIKEDRLGLDVIYRTHLRAISQLCDRCESRCFGHLGIPNKTSRPGLL